MTNFIIDIVSDPVCIWVSSHSHKHRYSLCPFSEQTQVLKTNSNHQCYIGKKRLDKAISLYRATYPGGRNDTFTVNWKAYYLDATAPVPGISISERLRQKVASSRSSDSEDLDAVVKKLQDRLVGMGRQEGIAISQEGKIGNTRSAHRAILFSKKHSNTNTDTDTETDIPDNVPNPKAHNAFVAALFYAYFEGTADITSHKDLADVAESVGLDRAAMLAWLDNGDGGQEVDAEDRAARVRGLMGVPNFTVQGQQLDGAQDVESFLDLFVRIKESEKARGKVQAEGKASGIVV